MDLTQNKLLSHYGSNLETKVARMKFWMHTNLKYFLKKIQTFVIFEV